MKTVVMALAALCASATAHAAVDGLENVVEISARPDGLFDVTCDYGDVETGYTLRQLKSGDVCNASQKLEDVQFRRFTISGECLVGQFETKRGVMGTKVAVGGLTLKDNEPMKGCTLGMVYNIPKGFKLGVKQSTLDTVLRSYEGGQVMLSYTIEGQGTSGKSVEIEVNDEGKKSHRIQFSDYAYTSCSKGVSEDNLLLMTLMIFAEGSVEKGQASFRQIRFDDVKLKRCY